MLFKVIRELHGQRRLDRLHLAPPRGGAADHRPRRRAARRRHDRLRAARRRSTSSGSSATWSARTSTSARRPPATRWARSRSASRTSACPPPTARYSVVDRLVARRARRRDRLHLRPDGRRPHRDDGDASPAGCSPRAAASCCTAATSPRLSHRRAHRRRPRAGARGPPARRPRADDVRRPEPLARQHRRLHQAACSPRASASSELVDRAIRDVTIKTAGGGAMIGSLSGGNQQKVVIGKMLPTDPSRRPARRAHPRHRHRRQGRGLQAARRRRQARPRRGLLDLRGRRVPERRPPHHRHGQRQDLRRVRART